MYIKDALHYWGLKQDGETITTHSSHLLFAKRGDLPVVVKQFISGSDEINSSVVLKHYCGFGAVRLLGAVENYVLLERPLPGVSLAETVLNNRDDEATLILCGVIEKLHSREYMNAGFPHVSSFVQSFKKHSGAQIPAALLEKAERIFTELAASQNLPILLHGDLHHYNVLYDKMRGWLAIDPKGYIGEAAYEVGAALRNPKEYPKFFATKDIIKRRVDIFVERLKLDRQRVLGWAFSQAVLSAIWAAEDKQNQDFTLAAAEQLNAFV